MLQAVQESNQKPKDQVCKIIFDYIQKQKDKAPKIIDMLIEFPIPQMYMSRNANLRMKV